MTSKRSKLLLTLAKNFNDAKQQSTSTITKLPLRRNLMHSFNAALNSDINDQNNQHNESNDNMEIENHTDVNEISCVNSKMNVQQWVNQCNFFDANEHKNNSVNMITLNGEDFEIIVQETPDYDNDVSVVLETPEHVFEPDFAMNIENVENVESLGIIDNIENDGNVENVESLGIIENIESDGNVENVSHSRKNKISKKGDTRLYRQNRKEKRNCGEQYVTNKGKLVNGRVSRPLTDYRLRCKTKINWDLQQTLFNIYWSMKSYDRRITYISNLIRPTKKAVTRKRRDTPEKQKNRQMTYQYHVPKDNEMVIICKLCFLNIFGETPKFIQKICTQKLLSPAQKMSPDKRGKNTPKNKKSPQTVKSILNHINLLPSYESHYCRKETVKKYLPPYFTMQLAYDDYKKTTNESVSRWLYEKHFKKSGLKIKNPKKDTCSQCDSLNIQIVNNRCTNEQKAELIIKRSKHHVEAEDAYESKRKDSSLVTDDICVIEFDLQQCLPTPNLESSVAFYKRQLWTFNLTVHNVLTSHAYCYIWNETIAKRGANDIGSCVFHYLSNLPPNISHVIMYSDCCPGQNKNTIFMAMCLAFLEQQDKIQIIDHKFMVPGHTRMECDSDHARIEKAKKRFSAPINHPHDWAQLIRYAGKDKFSVIETDQTHFLDFNSLLKSKYQFKKKMLLGSCFCSEMPSGSDIKSVIKIWYTTKLH
ncbi:uncharacterized protein LOC114129769 [Aphis gossypii]|uniref:uncharacterized protein LOC114129769 n=1 Tax=Aphis gossypii TaxID=80765 RepID=UPI0021593FB7|nr:uncharacterized protein LOC114129769 [Aphis gossypii]